MDRLFLSRFGFLRSGETTDCWNDSGTEPDDRERLMMREMTGARTDIVCLRMDVGIGSSSHCLVGDWRTSLVISSESVGRNSRKGGGVTDG